MSTDQPSELIIGIGSPFGDDRAGWAVIAQLEAMPLPSRVQLLCLDRPGPELILQMQHHDRVTLIDAVHSTEHPPGCCLELGLDQLAHTGSCSSHGFGLAHTLTLAQALHQLPKALTLFAITLGDCTSGTDLSPAVAEAARTLAIRLAERHQTATCNGGVGSLGSSSSSPS